VCRIRLFISLILLPLLFSDVTAQEWVWHGRCLGISDGDTINVLIHSQATDQGPWI
jgi:hypothetical protein